MRSKNKSKLLKVLTFSGISGLMLYSLIAFTQTEESMPAAQTQVAVQPPTQSATEIASITSARELASKAVGAHIRSNSFPEKIKANWEDKELNLEAQYTIDESLQKEADRLLKSYKPEYGAIVVMDATTGEILTMSSFQRENAKAPNMTLQATFPAASIFKVVTATAAIDKAGVEPEHKIHYNGGAHTLYKKNVLSEKVTRWTNVISLKDAFARSINTAFGRLSIENLRPEDLTDYANRYMFNQEIPCDFPVEMGVAYIPQSKGFELAEAASGYNKTNRMSPIQGAMIAASVANDGQMVVPYLVKTLKDDSGKIVYQGSTINKGTVMSKESSIKIRELMGQTVLAGTSRRTFRPLVKDRKFKEIEMGGKTGHLTGDNPQGRVDWFVGYAFDDERKIAVAAITINRKFWTVKSGHLGQSMFRKYFTPIITAQKNTNHNLSAN